MKPSSLDTPITSFFARLNLEKSLYLLLILLALISRLWALGDRVQSHDESIHTLYSWNLYSGRGFAHSPMMHGPFLFHATALTYFLLSDNDFTARIPVALIGVAIVAFPYLLRRWLGRTGALVTSFFLLISPSIAYYSRYIRHDIPVILWSIITIWAIFSYLHDRRARWLYVMGASVSLMFATKEVAFIYNAIFGFFLILLLITQFLLQTWPRENLKIFFLFSLLIALLGVIALGVGLSARPEAQPAPTTQMQQEEAPTPLHPGTIVGGGLTAVGSLATLIFLIIGHISPEGENLFPPPVPMALIAGVVIFGLLIRIGLPPLLVYSSCAQQANQTGIAVGTCFSQTLSTFTLPGHLDTLLTLLPLVCGIMLGIVWLCVRVLRTYAPLDLVILLGTLCLPLLSAGLIQAAGLDPLDYTLIGLYRSGSIVLQMLALSAAIGVLWDLQRRQDGKGSNHWLIAAAIYYAIFLVLFTTVFTNGGGIASGLVGSLGYWLAQQEVERGSQPWYYYFVTVFFYEYLPFLLSIAAACYASYRGIRKLSSPIADRQSLIADRQSHFIPFLLWWSVLAWVGYSYAGEKMPWLTTHIALPMIWLSGWLVGRLIERIAWRQLLEQRGWLLLLFVPPLAMAIAMFLDALSRGPFQSNDLIGLMTTGRLISGLIGVAAFGAGVVYVIRRIGWRTSAQVLILLALLLPTLITMRIAWRFCYVNGDYATEPLVYAHSAPAIHDTMRQIDELSRRTAGGANLIKVAYGADASTQFYWQLRNYPNAVFYGNKPSRESLDAPVVIAGREEWEEVTPYLERDYTYNTYTFMWWPLEDYRNLTWARITHAITDTQMRAAIWDIWYDRDYRKYAELTNQKLTLDSWPLRADYRLYIRRDVLAQLWERGAVQPVDVTSTDPYAAEWRDISARMTFGSQGMEPGQFNRPAGIKVGSDGFVYVADTGNHRIQKFTANGQFVAIIGQHSRLEMERGIAAGFNEPWDIAAAPDGTLYVADTWNHRIQKLDAEGNLLAAWGLFGQYGPEDALGQSAFYGPRGVAIGPAGEVYVTDTGNKRVQVFDPDGRFLFQWGGGGVLEGKLDEPVGIALKDNAVYIADTWNRRVQVFDLQGNFLREWPIEGWDTALPDEKPYLAVDADGRVYVTDPGHYRVLVFDSYGNYLFSFGQYGFDDRSFALPLGIAVAEDGSIYVTDSHGGRVMVFDRP